jgi:hypothetical protein
MSSVAIIMTGHPRYVPQGYQRLQEIFKKNSSIDFDIFSYTWSDNTDPRTAIDKRYTVGTDKILDSLGDKLVLREQKSIVESVYKEFLDEGCIPPANGQSIILPKEAAIRCSVQLVNFMLALEHWEHEWYQYDYIIKLRWDYTFDIDALKKLIKVKHADILTADFSLRQGQSEMTVDGVYGTRESMLMCFKPYNKVMAKVKKGVKERRHQVVEVFGTSSDYVQQSNWFTDGFLWYLAVKDNPVHVYQDVQGRFIREFLI